MSLRPADYFLGVIEFFGVLIPGGFFLLLEADVVARLFLGEVEKKLESPQDPAPVLDAVSLFQGLADLAASSWVVVGLSAFVVGHLLFAVGVALNPLYRRTMADRWRSLERVVSAKFSDFHRAFSYVRLHGPEVIGEVERAAGAYKLFRTLAVVFLVDAVVVLWLDSPVEGWRPSWRPWASLVLAFVSFLRFGYLRKWTECLAREYAVLIEATRQEAPRAER